MRAALLALAGLLLFAPDARADSWQMFDGETAESPDEGWFVEVEGSIRSSFKLYQRIGEGSKVVAQGPCQTPLKAFCLDGGQGFVLFENYGGVGHGEVLARYDGKGTKVWAKTLPQLFGSEQVFSFRQSVSSIWWYDGLVVGDEYVVAMPKNWDAETALLRVSLADGSHANGGVELLAGTSDYVRARAAISRCNRAPDAYLPLVIEALEHEDEEVFLAAEQALQEIGNKWATDGRVAAWVIPTVYRCEILFGLLGLVLSTLLLRRYPRRRIEETRLRAGFALLAAVPALGIGGLAYTMCSRPWAEGFLPDAFAFTVVEVPVAIALSVGFCAALPGLWAVRRDPPEPDEAPAL